MALDNRSKNFIESGGNEVIDLTGGGATITTDLLNVSRGVGFAIEAKTQNVVEGATKLTWTLKSTNLDDSAELKDFDINFAKDKLAGDAPYSIDPNIMRAFAIEIKKNNATGTIEFILTQ